MNEKNRLVDEFIDSSQKWKEEFSSLRSIAHNFELKEEVKWGVPCYTLNGKNVVLIHGFKEYCAMLFVKGVLLKDPHKLLVQQTENVQAGRQLRFTSIEEIKAQTQMIVDYISEAIENEKAGRVVEMKKVNDYSICDELKIKFDESNDLKSSFESLTPGRQKAYLHYFSSAKQSVTRTSRVEKCIPKIIAGKGLDD